MTRKTRKRIFYVLLILFVVVSFAVVLYAEGWRIDLTTLRPQTVGAIFVRSFPRDANISLNGVPVPNQAGLLSQGTLIANLIPNKTYTVTLKAPGYAPWTESAEVHSSQVAQFQYAVLVPETFTTVVSSTPVQNFFASNGNVLAQAEDGTLFTQNKSVGRGSLIDHVDFANMITQSNDGSYHLYDFTKSTTTNLTALLRFAGANVNASQQIIADPHDPSIVFAVTPTRIWAISPGEETALPLRIASSSSAIQQGIAISPSFIAWIEVNTATHLSHLMLYDRNAQIVVPTAITTERNILTAAWIKNGLLGIILDDGTLYKYDVNAKTLVTVANDVKSFFTTEDGTALAVLEHRSIEIFSLIGAPNEYYRLNPSGVDDIQSLIWYKDDTHLFLVYPNQVSLLDLADSGLHNTITVSGGTNPQYDPQENSLYIIAGNKTLTRFDFAQ